VNGKTNICNDNVVLDVMIFNRAYLFLSILANILQLQRSLNCVWSDASLFSFGYLRTSYRTMFQMKLVNLNTIHIVF
jgi:hypothetical protein